jgi:DNA-binding NarL/FixJ family response regulator
MLTDFLSAAGDFEVVATVGDGREALKKAEEAQPDVAILDWFMPQLNGLDAARQMIASRACTRIIILSNHHDDGFFIDAIRSGAKAYLSKEKSVGELVEVTRQVALGVTTLGRDSASVIAAAVQHPNSVDSDPLTKREREVLQLIAEGNCAKEIATVLGIATKTAENHRWRLMEKLNIHTIAGLTRYAVRNGIILP